MAASVVFKPDFSKQSLEEFVQLHFGNQRFKVSDFLNVLNPFLKNYFRDLPTTIMSTHQLIEILSNYSGACVKSLNVHPNCSAETVGNVTPETRWLLCEFFVRYFEKK